MAARSGGIGQYHRSAVRFVSRVATRSVEQPHTVPVRATGNAFNAVEAASCQYCDAVSQVMPGQKVLAVYRNSQVMLTILIKRGKGISVLGTCMDALGIQQAQLTEGEH